MVIGSDARLTAGPRIGLALTPKGRVTVTTMDTFGFAIIAFNLALIVGWPVLALLALFSLRRRNLDTSTMAIWVLIILAVPYLGALAYWIMRPGSTRAAPTDPKGR